MNSFTRRFLPFALMAALSTGAALAQGPTQGNPRTISFQGVLTDASGTFLPDGNHSLTLRIYDAATGGNELYTETQQILVVRGLFNALVGSTQSEGLPTSLRFDRAYFVGITVDGGAELSPRTAMASVPYAFSAVIADSAGHAVLADRALTAESARTLTGGAVTSVNGRQGAINIVGGVGTTVTSNGTSLVISSGARTDSSAIRHLQTAEKTLVITNPFGPSTTIDLAHNAVRSEHLVDGAVFTPKILDGAVTSSKLASAVITSDKLDNAAVTTGKIAAGAVTSAQILDGTVQTADLQNNAVTPAKISSQGSTAGQSLISNGTDTPYWGTANAAGPAGGDLAGSYPNPNVAATAGNNIVGAINNAATNTAIDYAKLNLAGRIATGDIANGAVATSSLADGSVTTPKLADASVTATKIAASAVGTSQVADGAITDAKVASGISYSKLTGAPTSLPPNGAASGDLAGTYPSPTIATAAGNSIVAAINDAATAGTIDYEKVNLSERVDNEDISPTAAIEYAKLALAGSIVTTDIADGAVTDAKVASGISYSKLTGAPASLPPSGAAGGDLAGSYPNPTVAAEAITSAKIADSSITNIDIATGAAISYSKLNLTNSIANGDLTANSVTTSKVANGTVTTSKMADSAISGLKLLTYAVTNRHLAPGAVSTDKIDPTGATTGQVLSYNGTNVVWGTGGATGTAGGDLAGTYPNPTVAASAINSSKIADSSITNSDIAPSAAISYSKLSLSNSIANGDLTANSITTSKVANGTVTTSKMADSAISGLKLLTYAVTNRHLAAGAVSTDKIDPTGATTGQVLSYNGTNVAWSTPAGGSTVTTNATLTGNGSAGSPLGMNLGNSNTWTANQTFGGTFLITANSRIAMTNSDNNARDTMLSEPSGTGSQYLGFRAPSVTNNGNYLLPAVVGSTGQMLSIVSTNGIDSATLAWSTPVTTIADSSISSRHISATAAIPYSKLSLNNSILNGDLTPNSITTSKVANGTVTTSKMADSAISGLKLLTYAVTNRHLATQSVSIDKISTQGSSAGQVMVSNGFTMSWVTPSSAGLSINRTAITSANSPYTIGVTADIIGVNQTTAVTVSLPAANTVAPGKIIIVKAERGTYSNANLLTVAATGTDTVNGAASVTINALYGTYSFYSDGVSAWYTF